MAAFRVRYHTIEFGDIDIHLRTLRDKQQFSDPEGAAEQLGISSASWPLFGVVWPSSLVLAHYLLDFDIGTKRVLEVGCGIGLSSLLLNKLDADISATDYHPEVEGFLAENARLNQGDAIAFERTGWADADSQLGCFDLIVGSDLLYEDEHVDLLANFIQQHANPACEVILVDPGRGRKNKLSKVMVQYGFSSRQCKPAHTDYLEQPFKGYILNFSRG